MVIRPLDGSKRSAQSVVADLRASVWCTYGGRELDHSVARPCIPFSYPYRFGVIYLAPKAFLPSVRPSVRPSARHSDPGTMTNTSI